MVESTVALRPIVSADWRVLHEWGSDPRVCRFQAWGPNTLDDSREFTARAAAAWDADPLARRVYIAESGGDVVGSGELRVHSRRHGQGEIQYLVHPRHWRRGLGTAIGRLLLRVGFEDLGLHRIYGTCDPRNAGSVKILRALGMTYEGRLRHTLRLRDGWRDSDVFGILDNEWAGENAA